MSEITVNDRRLFSKDGEIKEPAGQPEAEKAPEPEKPLADQGGPESPGAGPETGPGPGTESGPGDDPLGIRDFQPSFSSLVLALATSVMAHLGESIPGDPSPPRTDLHQAKHTIDLLGILETKTRGNLDDTEEQLLKSLLYDLRIRYVSLVKK